MTEIALLFAAGLLAGAVNAIAGGGTFFTFPALLLAGLPPLVANATNMVALVPANITALPAYRRQLKALGRTVWTMTALGLAGGAAGAWLLLALGGEVFAGAVPWLMALATLFYAAAPRLRRLARPGAAGGRLAMGAMLFVFSVYGAYFGAGLGQVLLAALILAGHEDFHDANALKNVLSAAASMVAALVYAFGAAVAWAPALAMFAGAAAGGYLGARYAQAVPARALRIGIICFGVTLTANYFLRGV